MKTGTPSAIFLERRKTPGGAYLTETFLWATVMVGFEYQEYLGFAENMYNDEWTATTLIEMSKPGTFKETVKVPGDKTYQWRAVVKHPRGKMTGEHSKVSVR